LGQRQNRGRYDIEFGERTLGSGELAARSEGSETAYLNPFAYLKGQTHGQ